MNQNSYWTKVLDHRVSRRAMLRGAGVAGIGLAGAALIGCGDDDDDDDGGGGGGGGGGSGGGTTPSASQPDSGVKRGGTLRVSNSGDPPTLDTYANNSFLTKRVAAFAYNRLFKLGTSEDILSGSALPVPDIAEGAEGKLLVHCLGGYGRAGTMGAALYIQDGATAEAAIAEIRARRPGAIESEVQRAALAALADDLARD